MDDLQVRLDQLKAPGQFDQLKGYTPKTVEIKEIDYDNNFEAGIVGVGLGVKLIILFISLISIIISVGDVGIDVADATVDAATGGVGGVATSFADVGSEIVLEAMQTGLVLSFNYLVSEEAAVSPWPIIILGLFDIVLSVVGFLPYFDIPETLLEVVSEIIQNAILLDGTLKVLIYN